MSDAAPDHLLYYLDAARSPEQRAYMEDLERRRVCVFCAEWVAEYQRFLDHREVRFERVGVLVVADRALTVAGGGMTRVRVKGAAKALKRVSSSR